MIYLGGGTGGRANEGLKSAFYNSIELKIFPITTYGPACLLAAADHYRQLPSGLTIGHCSLECLIPVVR